MFRRRRPLLRGAAVGAAGYAVGKRMQDQGRSEDENAEPQDDLEGTPSGGLTDETMDQLRKLGQLKEDGLLTQDEFEEQKRILLDSG